MQYLYRCFIRMLDQSELMAYTNKKPQNASGHLGHNRKKHHHYRHYNIKNHAYISRSQQYRAGNKAAAGINYNAYNHKHHKSKLIHQKARYRQRRSYSERDVALIKIMHLKRLAARTKRSYVIIILPQRRHLKGHSGMKFICGSLKHNRIFNCFSKQNRTEHQKGYY